MKKSIRSDSGAAAIEFAIVAPLLFVLLFGIIEFGAILYNKSVITNASREGARYTATFYTNPAKQIKIQRLSRNSLFEDYLSVFFLTITNPMPFFFFLAMFAGLNIAHNSPLNFIRIGMMVLGIFTGSSTWWLLLSAAVSFFSHRFRLRSLWWINKIAGIITFFLGIAAILSVWLLR